RRIAGENESTATLGLKAAQRALEVADLLPIELDLVIVATSTPENIFPSTASLIQDWLGASKAGAFDLSAACSGFVYAVDMASQAIRSGSIRAALVIGSETMSRVLDWQDRSTCILFGDGAGAVVLRASETMGGMLSSVLRSDGSGWDLLRIPTVGSKDVHLPEAMASSPKMHKMYMNGSEVFRFATRVISESITQALEDANLSIADVDLVVAHQANARILQSAARSLKVDAEMFMSNVDRYGNTSAASIPIALCEAIDQGRVNVDDIIVFVGFGGGLTWASMVIQWTGNDLEAPRRMTRQRRQAQYTMARVRRRVLYWRRPLLETIDRIRPERGRMKRLRRKFDRQDIE
ncbi:MAG: ketoacyl-ACP synthase III, partial [Anaerolineae bacterium]|nr:ketoacyl-ACP synthase III [Anaerolineae bacterium]